MKLYDGVVLINDREEYAAHGLHKGDRGAILEPFFGENGIVEVEFFDNPNVDVTCVLFWDLEVTDSSNQTDEDILAQLPDNDPSIWCKVEDGFVKNLKGECLNSIPYDYLSRPDGTHAKPSSLYFVDYSKLNDKK